MIRYALTCDAGHGFEGWFGSSGDFDAQSESGLVACPVCGTAAVHRALMAPALSTGRRKDTQRGLMMDQAQQAAVSKIREMVSTIRANAEDVGEKFPEEARRIHYGEADARGLIGRATLDEARALIEEGIDVAPLPILPDDVN
ncbi:hypothetical protein ASG25_13425 [Rhizobium sp. Leaf384]|uniref:DUF1178 family protein n=1 Tax=unclassified Rhizobium TaxID=2613769 RepID=UPI0007141069|nr:MULTISPECIES: DUF1178 family protein [unclassified Rhizobium]KQR75634.1 hypothetical protein ASG03_18260 [Rhizobium sp. Leaf341]KQS77605.1 hypothetical protein ASG25_13425 [Rhizobium sp. Leaf384]KQS83724.1 hypothetical protein ASG58_21860 [Rhizobium sp. Leaf383]